MSSDSDGKEPGEPARDAAFGSVGYLLFDSLVHHLIEKGILTKNDALSVVQTAAAVVRSRMNGGETPPLQTDAALTILERTYSSFEALQVRPETVRRDGDNVRSLRPSLHGDRPRFPTDD